MTRKKLIVSIDRRFPPYTIQEGRNMLNAGADGVTKAMYLTALGAAGDAKALAGAAQAQCDEENEECLKLLNSRRL